jgi:hypothetical protein
MSAKRVYFDTLRSLAFGGISAAYAAIGSAVQFNPRIICLTNDTDAGMIFSDDNAVSAGKLYLPAQSFKLFDLTTNMVPNKDDGFFIKEGTIIYVKQSSAPSSGGVYLEYLFGNTP